MFVWIIGFFALSVISAIFGFTGIKTPSTDAAVYFFVVFSLSCVALVSGVLIHRHETIIGDDLHRHH